MEIIMQTIRIIDYENNKVVNRDIPDAFSDYVRQLIAYVDSNTSIRGYRTRSINTEVISCVLDIVKNQIDEDLMTDRMNFIAQRLLLKEREAQKTISNMDTNVQKGSLIQALLYDEDKDSSMYLLAKVEHTVLWMIQILVLNLVSQKIQRKYGNLVFLILRILTRICLLQKYIQIQQQNIGMIVFLNWSKCLVMKLILKKHLGQ